LRFFSFFGIIRGEVKKRLENEPREAEIRMIEGIELTEKQWKRVKLWRELEDLQSRMLDIKAIVQNEMTFSEEAMKAATKELLEFGCEIRTVLDEMITYMYDNKEVTE